MLYAFNGAGVALPRVSRNQFNAGRKVPISDLRAGDMVFFRNGGEPIHHVAMYIGDGRMVEAPYTGADVRVVPLRTRGPAPAGDPDPLTRRSSVCDAMRLGPRRCGAGGTHRRLTGAGWDGG